MASGGASVERFNIGNDRVYVLRNRINRSMKEFGINRTVLLARGMNVISQTGLTPRGDEVGLIRTMPTIEESVGFIDSGPKHWNAGRFGAFIFPLPNRQVVERVIEGGRLGSITFEKRHLDVPVGPDNVMLHELGCNLGYQEKEVGIHEDGNNASITATGILNGWFSRLSIAQRISLIDGVEGRHVAITNIGDRRVPVSCTRHEYNEFPDGQPVEEVVLSFSAEKVVRTLTGPFTENESLLPDFRHNPLMPVRGFPFDRLLNGPFLERTLGDLSLDHCFTGLKDEHCDNHHFRQYVARLFYPSHGWGIETSVPFPKKSQPLFHALQVYSPPEGPAYGTAAFEFQGNVTSPLSPEWEHFPVTGGSEFNPGGMRVLGPGETANYIFMRRMITLDDRGEFKRSP